MVTQLSIRILASKCPLDAASFGVAFALPCTDLAPRRRVVRQPSAEALGHGVTFWNPTSSLSYYPLPSHPHYS